MITNINRMFKIQEQEMGYLCTEREACKAGEKYPIYIPRLMPSISFGEPTTGTISSQATTVFLNAPGCRVLASRILKTRNYLEIPFERNKEWGDDQVNITKDKDGKIISKILKNKTKVRCNCKTNVIDDMTFSND